MTTSFHFERFEPSDLGQERSIEMYSTMLKIRIFENKVQELFQNNPITGAVHLCTGQEAIYSGAAAAISVSDYVTCTYRGHGVFISRGSDLRKLMAEVLGRSEGLCKGKGGSMHFTDLERGLLGSFAIVGEGITVAIGAALTSEVMKEGRIAVSFFGEGASNIGMFHESLNMASVWKLPVVFICENNLYGEYSPMEKTTAVRDVAIRATSYDIPGVIVDGNNVLDVYSKVRVAAERARKLKGPTLLECKTYRKRGHSEIDSAKYRPVEELRHWESRDPIEHFRKILMKENYLSESADEKIRAEMHSLIDDSANFALSSQQPSMDEITTDVYSK
ncbi:MAG: thiamine pyrophosphate-dependent dehydrogenase E1 component subunit alpha [Nitrososphaerota archaeon]|nr:thiamine pyrophosphate-dependent dehydrogenase E1 component subunit alpha [Nitrososphaerota archaeon]